MNLRVILTIVSVLVCGVAVSAVIHQQSQLYSLREQRKAALTRLEGQLPVEQAPAPAEQAPENGNASPEILKLRSEVTRLSTLKRQLAGAPDQNRALRAQVSTNAAARVPLPEGYITRKSARMAGFQKPEETVETLLWAIENGDVPTLMQAFTPETAKDFETQIQHAPGGAPDIFKEMKILPGLSINQKKQIDASHVELTVTVVPGMPTVDMRLELIEGQWKLKAF